MAKIILTFLLLMVTGCSTLSPHSIITSECPVPPVIERPKLEIDEMKDGDDAGKVIQAHRITIKRLMKWGLEQETILNGYRK